MKNALLIIPETDQYIHRFDYLKMCMRRVSEENYIVFSPAMYEEIMEINKAEFINDIMPMVDIVYLFVDFGIDQKMFEVIDRAVASKIKITYSRLINIDLETITSDPIRILYDVCRRAGVKAEDLKTKGRDREVTDIRFIYFRRAKEVTKSSLAKIGLPVNRDHATVLHGIREAYQTKAVRDKYEKYYGTTTFKTTPLEAATAKSSDWNSEQVERPVLPFRSMDPREQSVQESEPSMLQLPGKGFYNALGGH